MLSNLKAVIGEKIFKYAASSVLFFLFIFALLVVVAMLSYTDWNTFLSAIISEDVVFAIKLSLLTATITTVIALLIAIPAAYTISKTEFKGKDLVDSMLDLPVVISPIALGAALLIFFSSPLGAGINDNFKIVFGIPGILLAQIVVVTGLAIRLLKSTFDGIDPRYEQVGRTLGCNKIEAFFRVTIPLAKNGLIAAAILTWARAIGEFGATVTLAGATAMKTETLPIAIYLSLASANINKAIALTFILIFISLIALLIIRKLIGRRYIW
jgi:molybdate transport system permease protein